MVDFNKKLKKGDNPVKINPIEIYHDLDRESITGPMRPAQDHVLKQWFNEKVDDRDLIIKLHTGEGKTLIGLLILQSKLNAEKGPCVFVCPNIYLVQQACLEAKKFGIPYCTILEDNELPNEFLNSKKILITHIQKIFNGKSKFGIDNNYTEIGTIILDDSHACIDSIKNSFTLKIPRKHKLYSQLLQLFEEDLKEQGEGSFFEIDTGLYNTLLMVPYWSWIDKKSQITGLLTQNVEEKFLTFVWPIIKNRLESCQAFVSGQEIEIVPSRIPLESFGSFHKAQQRILMSATTQDDSFFIKGLGFSINAVKNPLINPLQKWSGEKMLLIPSLIDDSLDRDTIVKMMAPPWKKKYGIVSLVPSFKKAEDYRAFDASIAYEDIFERINELKQNNFTKTLVIANRYDGIDLPDNSCRILIIDSLPYFSSLVDRYEEQSRVNSEILNVKTAQKIEQGLGRSVRGEKDYSVIIVTGADLVRFIKSIKTNKYFSDQTSKQIEIGLQIAEMAKDDLKSDDATKVLTSLINQSLSREAGWKKFYQEEMDEMKPSGHKVEIYGILQLEKEAEDEAAKGNFEKAAEIIQKLIDLINDDYEKGWYLQIRARYTYFFSKIDADKYQKAAFTKNYQLLKPREGYQYKKIELVNEGRISRITNYFKGFTSYNELNLHVDEILSDLVFGNDSEKFEKALSEVGTILGFISQRPDKEYRKGPDNLWGGVDNKYFLFECKSEVEDDREDITKYEAGQMNNHCGWFEREYGDATVYRFLVIPTKSLSYYGDFTHEIEIIRKGKLKTLKTNIKGFIKEFRSYNFAEMTDQKVQEFIIRHSFDLDSLRKNYSEKYTKKQHR